MVYTADMSARVKTQTVNQGSLRLSLGLSQGQILHLLSVGSIIAAPHLYTRLQVRAKAARRHYRENSATLGKCPIPKH